MCGLGHLGGVHRDEANEAQDARVCSTVPESLSSTVRLRAPNVIFGGYPLWYPFGEVKSV